MRRKMLVCMLIVVTVIAFMPITASAASKTVKMKEYEIYKSGKTLYCAGSTGLYKVKLKNGKVKSKKRLVKSEYVGGIKKKGNYIYFRSTEAHGVDDFYILYRVKTSGGKAKELATCYGYAIKGKKIYYTNINGKKCVMKLNGKSKKRTKVKAKTIHKTRNAKGFKVITKYTDEAYYDYLKTSKGKFYLGKIISEF